ncbi:MAG: cysteine desulfurase family protein [Simkaniaceae bacterium]|nr:cysteine desulfurase family protein [Candidatus Sacchlamyda saccharinae]
MQKIYLDNNATTPLDPLVVQAILAELEAGPANPSSVHSFGRAAHLRLSMAREQIANYLGVDPSELIFTSSGTESLNLAILGLKSSGHIISTRIEHPAVFETITKLNNPTTFLPVDEKGHIEINDLEEAIGPDTSLIALSAVNNETGVKNPIDEIAAIAEKNDIPLIVDGVALLGKENFSIPSGITAMAFSAHKIHGPKGVGLLYVKKKTKLAPLLFGGGQERTKRPGTENLPGIIGFAKAIELLSSSSMEHMKEMRDLLESSLPNIRINGSGPRVCNTSSITFPNTDGEALLIQLDQLGIAASMGSACSSGSLEPSRVLLEMGLTRQEALSTLRFSVSRFTTPSEIEKVIEHFSLQKLT